MDNVRKAITRYFTKDGKEVTREEYQKLVDGMPVKSKKGKEK